MDVCKRAALYLTRKKGKTVLLLLIFFLVSLLLLFGFSVLGGTEQAAKDLRSNIGAAFYIRPYTQMTFENGTVSEGATPTISQQSIDEVIDTASEELKAYNTEHYGYAKSEQLHFLPGAKDNRDNNMGRLTAVRDSSLTDVFLNEEYTLLEGRHIKPEDENKILISDELAAENDLKVGDVITLTHAGVDQQDGAYIDTIPQKTAFAQVEIAGIFQYNGAADSEDSPTAGKTANHMFSDCRLLVNLQEQQEGIYEGEVSFFIADPLKLDALLEKVESLDSIEWGNHILRENDFQYEQISAQLQNLQRLAISLIVIASVLSIVILMLILMMQIRGRIHETGIYLSIGKSKPEMIGQFILESGTLLLLGFLLALVLSFASFDAVNQFLFASLFQGTNIEALQTGAKSVNYLQPGLLQSAAVFMGELIAVLLLIVAASGSVFRLKPKEILTKMS